jgi:hypothetical protein
MRLKPIVLLLRAGETIFGDNIAGSVEFATVQKDTLLIDTAYVVPTPSVALPNTTEGTVQQRLVEGFGIIAVVKNDTSQADKTGISAIDRMHDIRKEFWDLLIGLDLSEILNEPGYSVEGPIAYKGDSILDVNPAWLWYMFEFEYPAILQRTLKDADLDDFNSIYTQYVLTPNAQIPVTGAEPIPDAIELSDLDQIIDLTVNLLDGAFDGGFDSGFDLFEG